MGTDASLTAAADSPPKQGAAALVREHAWLLALGVILIFAVVVRSVGVADNPPGFFTDEASAGLEADAILHTARDTHGSFLPLLFKSTGEYKLPVFIYEEVPFMAVFGRTETGVRLASAFMGSLTVIAVYLLGKELFRRELPAVASAAFLATLPWHIHYSRTGFGELVSFPLVLSLTLYVFMRAIRLQKPLWPAAVGAGLTFYTYRAAWVVIPLLMITVALMYRRELWQRRQECLRMGGVVVFFLLPIAWHVLSKTGDRSAQVWIFNVHQDHKTTLQLFRDFYKSYFSWAYLFTQGDHGAVLRHYLPGHGELYKFELPLLLAGGAYFLWRRDRVSVIVLAMLVFYPLSGALSDLSPISSRTLLGAVVYALILGAGVGGGVEVIQRYGRDYGLPLATLAVAVVVVAGGVSFRSYWQRYQNYPMVASGYWGWQDGPQEIMQRFLEVQGQYDQLVLDGDFNAPENFIPFYAGKSCPKCIIGATGQWDPSKRQLFALRPQNLDATKFTFVLKDQLTYPDGEVSFDIVEITGRR